MIATCLKNDEHNEFYTTAHVVQTWRVDSQGDFIEEISTDEIVNGPNPGRLWTCAVCGSEAIVDD